MVTDKEIESKKCYNMVLGGEPTFPLWQMSNQIPKIKTDTLLRNVQSHRMDFSALRILRKRNRITIPDMAKRIGISKAYLSLIENNRKSPNIKVIEDICKELDCELRILPKV